MLYVSGFCDFHGRIGVQKYELSFLKVLFPNHETFQSVMKIACSLSKLTDIQEMRHKNLLQQLQWLESGDDINRLNFSP